MAKAKRSVTIMVRVSPEEHHLLKNIALRQGKSMSSYLREAALEKAKKEKVDELPFTIFDPETVFNKLAIDDEEIEEELKKGNWNIPLADASDRILARAVAWAQKKYGTEKVREIGIFATMVSGFTTGLWGGFGQDQDPLFLEAQKKVIEVAGGEIYPIGLGILPGLKQSDKVFITEKALEELEKLLFQKE